MNKKIYIVVLLAIIITTVSETVSLIGGEHGFYQTVQDKCIKCHGDIKVQLSTSVVHSSLSCTTCHIMNNHTSTVTVNCRECHNPNTDGTPYLNDTREAHTEFNPLDSEGCVACHTTYNTIVNYSRAEYIEYYITNDSGSWTISNFTTNGTLNLSYNADRNGGNHNWKDVSCQDCHQDIFEAVSAGGHAVVYQENSSQMVPYHSNSNSTLETWCRTCHSTNYDSTNFSTQHAARKINCEDCHQLLDNHPGNFYTNIQTVPPLYRSLVCIACKQLNQTGGWINPAQGQSLHFTVYEEPNVKVVTQ